MTPLRLAEWSAAAFIALSVAIAVAGALSIVAAALVKGWTAYAGGRIEVERKAMRFALRDGHRSARELADDLGVPYRHVLVGVGQMVATGHLEVSTYDRPPRYRLTDIGRMEDDAS